MKKRRQTISSRAQTRIFLSSVISSIPFAFAFLSSTKPKLRPLHSTQTPDLPPFFEKMENESNFWRTIVTKQNDKHERIPCDPSLLDADGPLPAGAYQILGNAQQEPKPTCRLSISMDSTALFQSEEHEVVSKLHRFMDCGFNTFQLTDELMGVYRKLRADTPETVLNACQFVNTFQTPSTSIMAQPSIVRDEILHILRHNGGDCIDTLELKCMEFIVVSTVDYTHHLSIPYTTHSLSFSPGRYEWLGLSLGCSQCTDRLAARGRCEIDCHQGLFSQLAATSYFMWICH